MKMRRELKGSELALTALTMLIGQEGEDFYYYENDPDWWVLRLYISRN